MNAPDIPRCGLRRPPKPLPVVYRVAVATGTPRESDVQVNPGWGVLCCGCKHVEPDDVKYDTFPPWSPCRKKKRTATYDERGVREVVPVHDLVRYVDGTESCPRYEQAMNTDQPLALDVSLEKARALHRVWRALNDGDCPNCHRPHAATDIVRSQLGIECPSCGFNVTHDEIEDIQRLFAPAMNAAMDIFMKWRAEGVTP